MNWRKSQFNPRVKLSGNRCIKRGRERGRSSKGEEKGDAAQKGNNELRPLLFVFSDFAGFIIEFNRGFVSHVGGDWNGNLDAFNDYLSWADDRCTIRWLNADKSQTDLGHSAMADWLTGNLTRCHPTNRAGVQQRLDAATAGSGQTLFDWLVVIIRENSDFVELQLN